MDSSSKSQRFQNMLSSAGPASEKRITLIHRVIVPDKDYPKEYAILVTDRRSIFIRQPKTKSTFWLRGEMRWGTALITDAIPRTSQYYENTTLKALSEDPTSLTVPHESVVSFAMGADEPTFRAREFLVKWTMKRQKEIFQVYNFEMTYRRAADETGRIRFYAVPLGAYFKLRRRTQTREVILKEYAGDILAAYRNVLPVETIDSHTR